MIAYIDPTPIPGVSAPALQIAQTFGALANARQDVMLVTPEHTLGEGSLSRLPGHFALRAPGGQRRWFWPFASRRPFLWAACLWVARNQPRLLYLRNLRTAACLSRRFPAVPFVFEAHEAFWRSRAFSHANDGRGSGESLARFKAMEQRVYDRAAGVVAITAALAEDLRNDFGYEGPLLVAPDGVDVRAAQQVASAIEPTPGEVLYLGSGTAWKGIDTAIRAMAYVEGARLRVVGPTGEAARSLSALATELGVSGRVCLEPFVAPSRRFEVIARASLCLLPGSRAPIAERFTSPLKLFDYLACGRPVIAGDVPAVREVLTHDVTGWLAEVGNPQELAGGIAQLLGDERRRRRVGEAGARLAARYDWSIRAEALSTFLGKRVRWATLAGSRIPSGKPPVVVPESARIFAKK